MKFQTLPVSILTLESLLTLAARKSQLQLWT